MNPDDISRHVNACALMGCLRPPVGGSSPDHNRLRPRYCANQPPNPRPKNQPSRRRPPRGRSSVIRRPRRRGAMGSFAWPIRPGIKFINERPPCHRHTQPRTSAVLHRATAKTTPSPRRPPRKRTVDRDPQAAMGDGEACRRAGEFFGDGVES